ncbi:diguanylate cyclase [Faecalibacillus faecis]|uniref:diguanylate cyclase n=1 Tax=Faecalibacillus faecis TaxID=1982628 RepID=UPI003FD7BAB5
MYESTRKKLYYQLIEKDQQALIYFIDMDFMKKTNDLYGHDMGDSAIKEIASIILKVISKEDIAIRYGGDEFIIITNFSSKDLSTKITDEVFSFLNTHIPQVIIKIRNDSLNFLGFYV